MDIVTLSEVNTAPPALAIVVNWRTSSATRRGSGRTFLGPLHPAIAQNDGTPSDSNVLVVKNAAQALVDDSTETDGWALGVWGQQNKGVAEPKVLRDVISTSVRDRFAVLRSRRP